MNVEFCVGCLIWASPFQNKAKQPKNKQTQKQTWRAGALAKALGRQKLRAPKVDGAQPGREQQVEVGAAQRVAAAVLEHKVGGLDVAVQHAVRVARRDDLEHLVADERDGALGQRADVLRLFCGVVCGSVVSGGEFVDL